MRKEHLSWSDIEILATSVVESLIQRDWIPTVVVGLTRGGLTPAAMISHYFKIPMCSLDVSLRDSDTTFGGPTHTWIPEEIENGHRILVVDDINDSGATFAWIRDDWASTVQFLNPVGTNWPWENIKFASLLHNEPSPQRSDFYGKMINKEKDPVWIVFPWESWYQNNI